jgi:hypothetical protein
MIRIYPGLEILRRGEHLEVEGKYYMMIPGEIKIGDLCIGERNTGPHVKTIDKISEDGSTYYPSDNSYPYDWNEWVKVREI